MTAKVSTQVQSEALRIAKGTQKKAQTKEQTKLIAQGIEKGISEYKKQQKIKSRERDKQRKKALAAQADTGTGDPLSASINEQHRWANRTRALFALPWVLLLVSWGYFLLV